tara:strand:- start:405 stop:725 length:321 start_codon:yes stop_codon:yes gene_type:complete
MPNTEFNFINSISNSPRRVRLFITNLINQIRTLRIRNEQLGQQLEEAQQKIRQLESTVRQLEYIDKERCGGINKTNGKRCKNFGKYQVFCPHLGKHQGFCHHHRRH